MSLLGLFDLNGRNTRNYLFGGQDSIREQLQDGLSTEEQRRLQAYADEHIDAQAAAGQEALAVVDQRIDQEHLRVTGSDAPNLEARTVDEQFQGMENNASFRMMAGRFDP